MIDNFSDRSSFRLRSDLIWRRIWMSGQWMWVVKDPLAHSYFHFSDRDYEILRMADGERRLVEIARRCEDKFAPSHFSVDALVRFYADAQSKGLLFVPNSDSVVASTSPGASRWWNHPLALRMPGVRPDPVLEYLSPAFGRLFSPMFLVATIVIWIVALLMVVSSFSEFVEHASVAASRSGSEWFVLIAVISAMKIVHELAHGLTCRHFGSQCSEMGLMWLVGIPCLYCDVSDSWMLDRPWKRIFVAAAGMLAELTIAAVATLLWWASEDSLLRDVCVTIMIVGTVSTVLINGNPLLRYDGYYILVDLLGVPNLGPRSQALLKRRVHELLWGSHSIDLNEPSQTPRGLLALYGIASGVYRSFIYALIMWMLYQVAVNYGFEKVACLALLVASMMIVWKSAAFIVTPPARSRAHDRSHRPAAILAGFSLLACLALMMPFPHYVVAPMLIQATDEKPVVVSRSGRLEGLISDDIVERSDLIAELANVEVEQELLELTWELQTLRVQLGTMRSSQNRDADRSAKIASLSEAVVESEKRLKLRRNEADRLVVRSSVSGEYFPPEKTHSLFQSIDQSPPWIGQPLSLVNLGAWLESGTQIGSIGDPHRRDAVVYVDQQDIELVQIGQTVELLLPDHRRGTITGQVISRATSPVAETPEALVDKGTTQGASASPVYQVRVRIERQGVRLPVRRTGSAQIETTPTSIWARIQRSFRIAFGS